MTREAGEGIGRRKVEGAGGGVDGRAEGLRRSSPKPGRESGLALARSAMKRYVLSNSSWHYEHGLLIGAIREAGDAWGDAGLSRGARDLASALVSADGAIRGYRPEEFNLDMINSGRNLLSLFSETGETRLRLALDALASQLSSQPRTISGGFWHKLIYPNQIWLDGLYMAQPFAVRYGLMFGNPSFVEDAVAQFLLAAKKTRDPRTGLFRHAWDEERAQPWADPETGRAPNAWGRAMGWFAMALVDVIEVLYPGSAGRGELCALLSGIADALAEFQDPATGLWYQVLDQGEREGNYLEASVSSMLPYAFLKGVRLGALDAVRFVPIACRAYEGACGRFLSRDPDGCVHLEGVCSVAGLGGTPYRDGSFEYYVREPIKADDYKGVGPFILASIEYEAALTSRGAAA